MATQHKDSKAKALATASTLQKVVCPSTERDPLELLSSGYRKVDEQKRYTNRLTNLPDKGVGVVSRDGSFSEPLPGPSKGPPRTNGRAVLDQMFGHLRPHHNIAEPALLQMEQHELENALGDQAARAAFYRPSITAALMAIPSDNRLLGADAGASGAASASTSASISGALYRVGNSPMRRGRGGGDDSNQSEDGDTGSEPELPAPEDERPSTASSQRAGSGGYGMTASGVAGSGGSITAAGRFNSPRTMRPPMGVAAGTAGTPASPGLLSRGPEACNSPMRISANGIAPIPPGAGAGRAGSARRTGGGALPTVSRSYPDGTVAAGSLTMGAQLGCAGTAQPPLGAVLETPRLPAAATHAGAKRGNRRASVSGAEVAAAAAAAAAAAGLPAIGGGGGSPSPGGRARRASLVGGGAGYGASAAVAMNGLPSNSTGPPAAGGPGSQRFSMPGNSVALSGGSFSGGGNGMPMLSQRGGGTGPSGGGAGADGAAPAVASRLGMRSSLPSELALHGSPHSITGASGQGPQRSGLSVSIAGATPGGTPVPRVRLSYSGVGLGAGVAHGVATEGGAEGGPWPSSMSSAGLLAQLHGALHPEGSGPSPPAVNPAVPLSGLDALSATGLGDAISQLRNIRISAAGAPPAAAKEKPKKVEPGLAGVTPLSLLPVPLPPIENWQSAGKSVAELDPCKDIRLVDAPRCILPRPTEEQDLQSKMVAHKNAMRELVKAEGAPMSESEMEAVKLLGRLERSGARMRNYGDVEGSEQEAGGGGTAGAPGARAVVGAA